MIHQRNTEKAKVTIKQFREKWSKDRIHELTKEEFTSLENNSFIYDLEHDTPEIGSIRGGNAGKFGFFKQKSIKDVEIKNFISDGVYAWDKSLGNDAETAFKRIKTQLNELVEISIGCKNQMDLLHKVDSLECNFWPSVKWKIAFMYADTGLLIDVFSKQKLLAFTQEKTLLKAYVKLLSEKPTDTDIFYHAEDIWLKMDAKAKLDTDYNAVEDEVDMKNRKDEQPFLNQILYGPPGTGKTYKTVDEALKILGASSIEEWQDQTPKSIQDLKKAYPGQVEFVTFHQSFSYEDFVEGIRAIPPHDEENDSGQMVYKTVQGVFRKICDKASSSVTNINQKKIFVDDADAKVWKTSIEGSRKNDLKDYCFSHNEVRIGWSNVKDVNSAKNQTDRNTLESFESGMNIGDVVVSLYDQKNIDAVGVITGDYEWDEETYPRYPRKRSINWLWHASSVNDIKKIYTLNANTNLVQKTVYQLNRIKPSEVLGLIDNQQQAEIIKNNKKYVLIIDEINRGNISRIFGELITVIEDSKRGGEPEEISVTLPYSGDIFSVPKNLYIIGTMNTADRSLALLDTALRRRFDFIEKIPAPELLTNYGKGGSVEGVSLMELLNVINQRVEALYDREHTIGHAFFMHLNEHSTINDLAQIFKNKILPLLEEYFYDDWDKIRLVLGDQYKNKDYCFYRPVNDENHSERLSKLFPNSDSKINRYSKKVIYQRQIPETAEAFRQIYNPSEIVEALEK